MSEVLGDEAGVAALLPQPGCGGVAKRVGGDVLLDPGSRRGASDDVGEDRLLQAGAVEPAEDRVGWPRLPGVSQRQQLAGEASGDRLTAGTCHLSRGGRAGSALRPSSSRSRHSSAHSSERRSPVVTRATRTSWSRSARPGRFRSGFPAASSSRRNSSRVSQSRSCRGFGGGSRSRNGSSAPTRRHTQRRKRRKSEKAAVVRRRRRVGPLPVGGQVVDDGRFIEDAATPRLGPVEQVVDRDAVCHLRALALLRGLEPPQPVVARLPQCGAVAGSAEAWMQPSR